MTFLPFAAEQARPLRLARPVLLAMLVLQPLSLASAREPSARRTDFRGIWSSEQLGVPCRSGEVFLLVYDRKTADFPYRSSIEPGRRCHILSIIGRRPEWKLRMSCLHPDPKHRLARPFELRQTLRMDQTGFRMTIDTEPVLDWPAHRHDAFLCRPVDAPPPPLLCYNKDTGGTKPCEP